ADKEAAFNNQYAHADAVLLRGVGGIAGSLGKIAGGIFGIVPSTADVLYGARLKAQQALGIRPAAGAIIGTLSVMNAFIGTAAYAATPHQTVISNAHMMSAFQQACLSNDSVIDAAFDMTFSPDANPD